MDDSESLFNIRTNEKVMKFMDVEQMSSISESEQMIESIGKSFKLGSGINWGIIEKSTKTFIGYFGFWRIDSKNCRGEIGYALHPNYWNKGFMKESAMKLIEYGFSKLNLHSIEANVSPDNLSSIQLLEKIGFKKEAHFRENLLFKNEFKDSVIYSLLDKEFIKK
jgi:ribosomal-protein-alanine N-acetyltransferase